MKSYWYIYEFGLGDRSTTFARVAADSLADAKANAIAELGRRDLLSIGVESSCGWRMCERLHNYL